MPIRHYLHDKSVFDPPAIKAMSEALERACSALHINGDARGRETIAARIIELARYGTIDAKMLSDRVIEETTAMQAV